MLSWSWFCGVTGSGEGESAVGLFCEVCGGASDVCCMSFTILLSTSIFPNRFEINRGVYIKRQALELGRRGRLTILSPVPYYPSFLKNSARAFYAKIPAQDNIDGLEVQYPRFFIVPKLFRFLHGPFMFGSLFLAYRRVIRREKPDVMLGFWAFPDGFATVLLARIFRLPVLVGVLGCDINYFTQSYLRRKLIGWALRSCDQVLSVSEALKREMVRRLDLPPGRVTVIPNGIEEGRFFPQDQDRMRELLGLDREDRIVLCVARLAVIKGVDVLVRAFARVEGSEKRLVVVGDGEEMPHLKTLVEELGLSNRVRLAGSKSHEDIPAWINAADLLVLPSINEGWPNVLMEAFACGKPVVASEVGGVPEIVNDSALGILTRPGDAEDLARGIEEGLGRDWDQAAIRARVQGRSWAVVADELHRELERVLERHRSS